MIGAEGQSKLVALVNSMASIFGINRRVSALTGIKVEALSLPEQQFERQTIALTSSSPNYCDDSMLNWKFIPGGYLELLISIKQSG